MSARSQKTVGFTLIELMVVTLILGVVATAIGVCVAAGIHVLESARGFCRLEARAQVGLGVLERDVRNCFAFYAIPFDADDSGLSFPGLVVVDEEGRERVRIGTVSYSWDRASKALVRERWRFPPLEKPYDTRAEGVIGGVRALRFSYLRQSESTGEEQWVSSWQSVSNRPVSVRIELTLDARRSPVTVNRVIRLRGDTGEQD